MILTTIIVTTTLGVRNCRCYIQYDFDDGVTILLDILDVIVRHLVFEVLGVPMAATMLIVVSAVALSMWRSMLHRIIIFLAFNMTLFRSSAHRARPNEFSYLDLCICLSVCLLRYSFILNLVCILILTMLIRIRIRIRMFFGICISIRHCIVYVHVSASVSASVSTAATPVLFLLSRGIGEALLPKWRLSRVSMIISIKFNAICEPQHNFDDIGLE